MRCPQCKKPTLREQVGRQGSLVEVCSRCHGLWLDGGEVYDFSDDPRKLDDDLADGLDERKPTDKACPRCQARLEEGLLPGQEVRACSCPGCGGLWFPREEVQRVNSTDADDLPLELPDESEMEADAHVRQKADDRLQRVASGMLALPNLFLRSALTLLFLYGILGLVLITLVELGYLGGPKAGPYVALAIGVGFAVLQFTLGPWIMDLSLRFLYRFEWLDEDEIPDHLYKFIDRVCTKHKMKFPSVGLIEDGAPAAFTYGHHPSNARVVISQGILDLLEPAEVEAVVAHELGHARNWDMALMTVANLVPLMLYFLYRVATDWGGGDKKDRGYGWAVALGAYVLYIVSEYVVLWFSRTREYFADRFAGKVTKNPNALASALVKIAYGLAAQGPEEKPETEGKKGKDKKKKETVSPVDALGALNIFDRKSAVGLVMASSTGKETADTKKLNVEWIKSAMQWDLWNPWAKYYELHSTHPLVAKRLQCLTDQAASMGQDPLVVFDRRKPESYWDEFLVDLVMMALPGTCFLVGLGVFAAVLLTAALPPVQAIGILALALGLAGVASLLKTAFSYRRDFFPRLSVAALLHKVKVSAVRPVPATLTGTIIGKGVPGLVWSEDFVLKDRTGIIFLDYRQPLALWSWLFGLLRAERYQGKEVRVTGWFRRAPVPYLEVRRLEVVDGSQPARNCYSYHARLLMGVILTAAGLAAAAALWIG